jgi:hypothetical protein
MTDVFAAPRLDWRLLVGPILLVLGLALLKLSDILLTIGPLDRAAFGWSVPVPMILLAPGAVGAAAHWSGPRPARRAAMVTGVLLGIAVGVAWFASTTQVGCNQHPDTAAALFASVPVPLVLGLGWAAAGRFSIRFADRLVVAVVAGVAAASVAGVLALLTVVAVFPALSCAYVPPPA